MLQVCPCESGSLAHVCVVDPLWSHLLMLSSVVSWSTLGKASCICLSTDAPTLPPTFLYLWDSYFLSERSS